MWRTIVAILVGLALVPVGAEDIQLGNEWNWQAAVTGPGEFYSLHLQVRASQGSSGLEMSSCPEGTEGSTAQPWWHWELPADGKTHRVEMVLNLPVGTRLGVRLAGEGQAAVQELRIQPLTTEPKYADNLLTGVRPVEMPEPLPEGWEPEGTLDARSREIGEGAELVVDVGGLTLSSPAEITVAQGYRAGPPVYISNLSEVNKTLHVVVQGPTGSLMPTYSVPIASRGTTAFAPPLQLMRVGTWWVRYTFSVGEESASLPLKVQVKRAYPVLMVAPSGARRPVSEALPYASTLWSWPTEPGPEQVWELGHQFGEHLADLQQQVQKWNPPLLRLAFEESRSLSADSLVRAYKQLYRELLPQGRDTAAISPNFPMSPSEKGLEISPEMRAAFDGGLGKYVQSVGVGIESLPEFGGPLLEKLDGKAPQSNEFWRRFMQRYDFTGLRQFLAANEVALPLLLDVTARPLPREGNRLTTLALARLMLEATWQGGTGTVLTLEPELETSGMQCEPEFSMICELWRELTAARPLYGPTLEDGSCSHALDAPVTYWSFVRGNEGIVFLANNTSAPQELAVEVRGEPVQMQVLRLKAFGAPVTRQIQDVFKFSEEANERHQQAIYLRLAPGEIVGMVLLVRGVGPGWLRSVGRRPASLRKPGDVGNLWDGSQGDPWTLPRVQW